MKDIHAYSYVRFSSPQQGKGDSSRRQLALSDGWSKRTGIPIDTMLNMRDLGRSAWTGQHLTPQAALGQFIEAIKTGRVKRGSYLLVESLDRLSRQNVTDALPLFLDLLNMGITVVTLLPPEEVFTKASVDKQPYSLMGALASFIRANEESRVKSQRVAERWANNRKRLSERRLTRTIPSWLTIKNDKFEVKPDAEKTIELIFRKTLDGMGSYALVRYLHKHKIKNLGTSPKWNCTYIHRLLTSRAILGEFQPYTRTNHKRQPAGDPVPNYYPPVKSVVKYFDRVQEVLATCVNWHGKAGRWGAANLFTGILTDANNGENLVLRAKTKKRRLVNIGAESGLSDQPNISFLYDQWEEWFLRLLYCLKPSDILPPEPQHDEIAEELDKTEAALAKTGNRLRELTKSLTETDTNPAELLEAIATLKARQKKQTEQRDQIKALSTRSSTQLTDTTDIVGLLEKCSSEEKEALRPRLKLQIARLVKSIKATIYDAPRTTDCPRLRVMAADVTFYTGVIQQMYVGVARCARRGGRNDMVFANYFFGKEGLDLRTIADTSLDDLIKLARLLYKQKMDTTDNRLPVTEDSWKWGIIPLNIVMQLAPSKRKAKIEPPKTTGKKAK